jgi:uncharacterized protein
MRLAVTAPTILELWRYPVKSMGGERLERTRIAPRITGDREWGVFDTATGKLLSAKSVGTLLLARARYRDGETTIELPTGATLIAGAPATNDSLSAWLDRRVELRRAGATEVSTIDMEVEDAPMTSFTTHPGYLYDSRSTLHLISVTTLAAIERDNAPSAGAIPRYRPNLLVSDADEDAWVDSDIRINDVVAHVRKRTERCVIISRPQPGLDADRTLIRALKASRDMRVGVYLDPRTAGDVAVGDAVVVQPSAAMQNP